MGVFVVAHEAYFPLAKSIAAHMQLPVYALQAIHFADSEMSVRFKEPVTIEKPSHAVLVHSTAYPVHENLIQLLLSLHMLKKKGIEQVTAVIPYFGYARQDRQGNGESVAQFMIKLLHEAGADRIVTVELHNPAIMQEAPLPIYNITLSHVIAEFVQKKAEAHMWTVIAPDKGALERVAEIARILHAPIVVNEKERYALNKTRIIGSEGVCITQQGVIVDDIIDTGSTIINVVEEMRDQEMCQLYAFGVHPVLSGDAVAMLQNSQLERIWVTNTIPWQQGTLPSKFEVVDISGEIAKHITV